MMFVRSDKDFWQVFGVKYFLDEPDCFLDSSCRSASSGQNDVLLWVSAEGLEETLDRIMHHLRRELAKMTELSVRVGHKSFCVVYHGFNRCVGTVGCCVVNINCLQFDVVWAHVTSAQPNNVLSDFFDLCFWNPFVKLFFHVTPARTVDSSWQ